MDPDSYDFTPRVQIQITKDMTKPVQCRQCPKPKCMEACPFNAISMGEDSVILDQDICKGCGKCAKACPFDGITMARIYHGDTKGRPFRQLGFKCDLCHGTESGIPACIEACPTEVFTLFDPAEAAAKAKAALAAKQAAASKA